MADNQSKIDAAAEKAYADAAQKKSGETVSTTAVEKAVAADPVPPAKAEKVAAAVASTPAKAQAKPAKSKPKPVAKKPAAKKAVAKKAAAKAPARKPAAKPAPKKVAARKPAPATTSDTPTIAQLKDKIMATTNTDFTQKIKETAADAQTRMKAAYDKGAEMTTEVVQFQKGNLEALVESGKLLAGGMQDMGRVYLEDAKLAAETVQDDVKKMAAVKSPTEFFQLQGELVRRNFDAVVARASRNVEMTTKLVNEAFAPISTRASLAAERISKAA